MLLTIILPKTILEVFILNKILLLGSYGQLGHEVAKILNEETISKQFKENDIQLKTFGSLELDIVDNESVLRIIREYRPEIIINCAAYTNVDKAEEDVESAFQVNALGVRNLAIASEQIGAKLLHISTDYVFDGMGVIANDSMIPYREYDIPNPINVYGKSKLLGEQYVKAFCNKYFIVRTSWLYGKYGNNFVKTIINKAKETGVLQVVKDQVGSPTNAEDIARHIIRLAMTDEYGTYHCAGKGIASWYDFACKIIDYAGIDCLIEPITSEQYRGKARRPSYSCLDNRMLRNTIGDDMRRWEEALYDFIKNTLRL